MFTMGVSEYRTTQYANYTPRKYTPSPTTKPIDIEHLCAPVNHPTTIKLLSRYTTLQKDTEMKSEWKTSFGKEFGSLKQGDNKTGSKVTN